MTPDIFLSYSREDQATAQRFAEAFEAQGHSVWWDAALRPGETFDEVTEQALRTARAVVVLWSPRSISSRWVRAEAAIADRNKTLMPVTIEPCNRPVMFELTQTADLSHWAGEANDPAWRAFLADVRRFVEGGAAPTPPVPRPSAPAAPTPPMVSNVTGIAVLPFVIRSGREEDDVFADGMVEDLTAALSVNPMRKVVAASATAIYRKGVRDLRQIGRDLGVRYLLEGNVRRVGADLRVTAQLVEAESESILWTHKFDRPLVELAALQEDLVAEVAAHLNVQVGRAAMAHALRKSGNISAEEAMMRAQVHFARATRSGWETAVAEARRAVEIDPNSGGAHGVLASAQAHLLVYRGGDDPTLVREILDDVRRALELDPNHPSVLSGAAAALATLGKPEEALPFAERAVALSFNAEPARLLLGSVLARLDRSDEALAQLDGMERQAPNSYLACYLSIWRAVAHLRAGRLDRALEAADQAVRLLPGTEALTQSMLCLAKSNRWDDARAALRRLRDADPQLSCASIEGLTRYFYRGSNAIDDYAAIVRKVWDEVERGASNS
jgi:TolB-like protein